MADDDEESLFGGLYEDGHWEWDETAKELIFVSDIPPEQVEELQIPTKAPTGTVEFRDDLDIIEQIRFRRRYQRKTKPGQPDVITVQGVKDLALYTAPFTILSPMLISMLHLPTTERFIRALVLYVQYYLQISDEMANRIIACETKIRTPQCEILERDFRENLSDLRILVAKEYSTVLVGGCDTKKFHHMGPNKKRRSLSDKDARFIETFIRMCVQIVWLALGRQQFNQIELEVNRIFKTEIFNSVEHRLHTDYVTKMTKVEKGVLLGECLRHDKKLNTRSPLMNEVFCHRDIDYRMLGLGAIKYNQMTHRQVYLKEAISGAEEQLAEMGIVLGIIGLPQGHFDTMLKPLPITASDPGKSKSSMSNQSQSKASFSMKKSQSAASRKLYSDIVLPDRESTSYFPPRFSIESEEIRPCSVAQHRRWHSRLRRLLKMHRK
ncbi:protein phosphatase 1 regulatory subunit 36-like [Aricia agestis]|uniref:protein phosphatase 1 regulatory subunit 36-like n=1 Tax=Aricia agestis TaxID=91739 RepID=UPI001C20C3DB|nr:protein phosphatase 1 regulatory subunit 36-like [Aricia agestis]